MITLSSKRTAYLLLAAVLGLLGLDMAVFSWRAELPGDLQRLLDITQEGNLPTWFSSLLFLFCGTTALFLRAARRDQGQAWAARGWLWVAAFFIYAAMDDTARFHERVGHLLGKSLAAMEAGPLQSWFAAFPSWYWQATLAPLFAAFALFMVIFLFREFKRLPLILLFLAGLGFYAEGTLLDYVDGLDAHLRIYRMLSETTPLSGIDVVRHAARAVEETLEMVGTVMILAAFLEHWRLLQAGETGNASGENAGTATVIEVRA